MGLFTPQTVRSSLWPSLVMIWTFAGPSTKVKLERRIFYAILMTVIILFVNINALARRAPPTAKTHMFGYISLIMDYLKISTFLMLIWLWGLKGVGAVENSVVELTNLDEELKNFRLRVNHERFMWKQLLTIGGFVILFSSVAILQPSVEHNEYDSGMSKNSWMFFALTLFLHIERFQALVIDSVIAMVLEALRIRFKLVNEVFKRIAESEDQMKVKVFTTSYSRNLSQNISGRKLQDGNGKRHLSSQLLIERIDRACRIHRRLLKVTQDVRDVLSMQLCMSFPITITVVAIQALTFVSSIHTVEEETLSADANAVSALFMAVRCWQIIMSCSNTSDEANDLGISLYRVPIEDDAVHKQLQEHSVHILQRKLRFTVGGILVVDRNLATSAFSTIVKYLVILIQFQEN